MSRRLSVFNAFTFSHAIAIYEDGVVFYTLNTGVRNIMSGVS